MAEETYYEERKDMTTDTHKPARPLKYFKDKALIGATLISLIVAIGAVCFTSMSALFGTIPLNLLEFLTVLVLSSTGFIYLEISKNARSKMID